VTPILFLTSGASAGSGARRIARIASGLDPARFQVEAHPTPVRHALDWNGVKSLRRIAAALKPKIVHTWGPDALRASFSIASSSSDGGCNPCVVASDASFIPATLGHWPTRRRLRRCDRVVVATWVEAERYRHQGVPADRLTRIAPGVGSRPAIDRAAVRRSLNLPERAHVIATGGRLDHDAGTKLAIWAFGLMCNQFPNLHLVVLGDGPARASLAEFALATLHGDLRVHFAGERTDEASIVAASDLTWAVHPRGDWPLALEAMAAGVPVVAWRLPEMAELIEDGVSGALADSGQPARLAAETHMLFADDGARTRLGEAAALAAQHRFHPDRERDHFAALYDELRG